MVFTPPLARWCCGAVVSLLPHAMNAEPRTVDFRFGIPTWHQPLGIPEDWHKPMTNERGALLYDFGPGPYVQPLTTVELTAEGEPFDRATQTYADSPRVPIMRSRLTRGEDAIEVTTFSAPRRRSRPSQTAAGRSTSASTASVAWSTGPGRRMTSRRSSATSHGASRAPSPTVSVFRPAPRSA